MKTIARRLLGDYYAWLARQYNQVKTYSYSITHPYHYDPKRYEGSFLTNDSSLEVLDTHPVERVIYIFWTADNEITPNRLKGIESLERVSGVKVQLITPRNLPDYIMEEDPLPEAYQYLSLNHRSDYLRSYFMHHYGGGYADVKTYYHSWVNAFERLDASKNAYVMGYPEVGFWGAANYDMEKGNLERDLYWHWRFLIGNGAFICRPHTKFTEEWHREVKHRLISMTDKLREHPASDYFGKTGEYPIRWSWMQGAVFHPLCLKYHDRLLKDKSLMPSFKNYR